MRRRKVNRFIYTTVTGTCLSPIYAAVQVEPGKDEKLEKQETWSESTVGLNNMKQVRLVAYWI